mgnify:CR=1 FL=1
MPISQTDQLFRLIKSLSKAEKRNFTIYAKRIQNAESLKFVQLFEFLEKQKLVNDDIIIDGIKELQKSQLPNLKRHLYRQILISLRMIHIQRNASIEIREFFDYAEILYGKGLYRQSLKILRKAQHQARKNGFDIILLEINEFKKVIESRHITRTGALKNKELAQEAHSKIDEVSMMIKLSNLRLLIHGEYIRNGHIRNKNDYDRIKKYFNSFMPEFKLKDLGFTAKIYLYQSYVWYYYILLDFRKCYKYALKWVDTCKAFPLVIHRDPDLFMRGYHYLLTSAYNNGDYDNYKRYLPEVEQYRDHNYTKFNMNSKIISFMYVHHGRINNYFLSGRFREGVEILPQTLKRINQYRKNLDEHRILVFYFKIAWMYFGNQQPDITINYLNRITNRHIANLRADIQGYSRLLFLMAHYDLENYDVLEYVFKGVKRFFDSYSQKNKVQEVILDFFKVIMNLPQAEHQEHFEILDKDLKKLEKNTYEKRPFLYLNVPAWVQSKLLRKPMAEIIQESITNY